MKMDSATTLSPEAKHAPADTTEIFLQLGSITRLLHDTLKQLGVMPKLQQAAEKVLNSVDQAKAEHGSISGATRRMAQAITADPVKAVASGAVFNFVADVEQRTAKIDGHLTDIMMAQDFHDLTGQVVAKVVTLAGDLEDSLLKLLVQVIPPEQAHLVKTEMLNGPVVDATGRTDVVTNQGEVDDLLASLGF